MEYAVLDWDNTIRKGFTLFSWIDFLYEKEILDRTICDDIFIVQNQYANGMINHDEYARISCEIYSSAMKGVSKANQNRLVKNFIQYDKKCLMPFSEALFNFMNEYNIKPVIISGAPQYILDEYKGIFGLDSIFAFSEEYVEGLCTGRVAYNYGVNKGKTVEKLYKDFGLRPLAGFGDSYSDIPLFKMSKYAFCIVNTYDANDMSFGKEAINISDETTGEQIRILLKNILKLQKL